MRWHRSRPSTPPAGPRRDRHGRGVRGPLAWPAVPAMVSRSQRFDDCVLDAVERLGPSVGERLDGVEFAVLPVPQVEGRALTAVPLAETFTAGGSRRPGVPARIVLYRRPIEARARSEEDLAELVGRAVVEQVASLLFLDPRELDDRYEPGDD